MSYINGNNPFTLLIIPFQIAASDDTQKTIKGGPGWFETSPRAKESWKNALRKTSAFCFCFLLE